ncbi:MAG: DNA-binding protein YbiB [Betaproteobacteria bacterium]
MPLRTVEVRAAGRFMGRRCGAWRGMQPARTVAMEFTGDIRAVLRRAPPLDIAAATRLWGALLDGALDDVEVGAIVAALAVAGETPEELAGFCDAAQSRVATIATTREPGLVAIPAYGLFAGEGAIVALTAMLLRRFELRVLVHGVLDAPCGASCARVLRELDVLPSASLARAQEELAARAIAFVPVHLLSPALARLLALRSRLGVDSSAHVVAPLLDPTLGVAMRLVLDADGARGAMRERLLAGACGDALALTWSGEQASSSVMLRRPRIERWRAGARELLFEADGQELRVPPSPALDDAVATAAVIRAIATGRAPMPVPALNLVAACLYAAGRAPDFARAKAAAAVAGGRLAA